jgi:phosphatidylserine decarboxylase
LSTNPRHKEGNPEQGKSSTDILSFGYRVQSIFRVLGDMFQFAREGYPFITFFLLLTIATALFGMPWISATAFLLTLFMFYFFRDPERLTPEDDNAFYAPADGLKEDEFLKGTALKISIFMSPLDVHVNRAPCAGTVKKVMHKPGKFYNAYTDDAAILNEHISMLLHSDTHGDIVVKQIAGAVARRCVCRVNPGASLAQGERYGMIKFSSRADIFLPLDTRVKVKLNDKVTAGETVLAVRD